MTTRVTAPGTGRDGVDGAGPRERPPAVSGPPLYQRLMPPVAALPLVGRALIGLGLRTRINRRAITRAKIDNFVLANQESAQRRVDIRSLPYVLNIDTINGCNLTCPFCPTGTRQLRRKRTRLTAGDVERIIDQTHKHVLAARFHNWGEPFLNPDIFDMIRYTADRGVHTAISSNLSVKTRDLGRQVVESKLDHLHVSFDGLEQATLATYRRRADIERVYANIRDIVAWKRRLGSATPHIHLAFLVFRHNEGELPRLKAVKRELGADSVAAYPAFIYERSFVPDNPRYQPMQAIFGYSCHYLYSELTIEADGAVSPCCTNSDSQWDVGSIADLADLRALWHGERFRAMRAVNAGESYRDAAGQRVETLCDHCEFVGGGCADGRLSPLPPALRAAGETFAHGLDDDLALANRAIPPARA